MGYEIVETEFNGNIGSTDGVLTVNVLKAESGEKYWDKTYNYVSNELERIYNDVSIEGTIARKWDTDASISCSDPFDSGFTWLDNNDVTADGNYLWVVGDCDEAVAQGGYYAWNQRRQAIIGEDSYSSAHEVAFSGVHEALHPYLAADTCDEIRDGILNGDGDGDGDDHLLGMVYTSWWGDDASVMLGHYDNDVAGAGSCNDTAWTIDGYTADVTDCTMQALEMSMEHAEGNH